VEYALTASVVYPFVQLPIVDSLAVPAA